MGAYLMPMHTARIDTDSKPARIVRLLDNAQGRWVDAYALQQQIGATTAVSTHVSAARQRLKATGRGIDCDMRPDGNGGWRCYYRIVGVGEQMEIGA